MSLPEPEETDPPAGSNPGEHSARPDWLTGADPSQIFTGNSETELPERLKLVPPSAGAVAHQSQKPPASAPKRAWTAAASSIPVLHRETAVVREPIEEEDEADLLESRLGGFGEMPEDAAAPAIAPAARPLEEPWWIVAGDELRTNRRVQVALAAALLGIAAFVFWPRGDHTVSIATLQRHAHEYDGRAVTVRGRVGDVFPMSGGNAFYLRQGRESIVVFSRTRLPLRDQSLTVKGTISTGYLEGAPHQALFEDNR